MNEYQQKCYDEIKAMFHDEQHDCTNLSKMIEIMFPEDDNDLTTFLRECVAPCLDARADLGQRIMQLFYDWEKP